MKMSKKLAVIFVLVVLAFSLTACSTEKTVPAENRTNIMGEWTMDAAALNALAGVDEAVYADIKYRVEDLGVVFEFKDDIVDAAEAAQAAADAAAAQVVEADANVVKAKEAAEAAVKAIAAAEEKVAKAKAAGETAAKTLADVEALKAEDAAEVEKAKAAAEEAAKVITDAETALADAVKAKDAADAAVPAAETAAAEAAQAAETAKAAAEEAALVAAAHLEKAKAPTADFTQTGKLLIKVTSSGETAVSEEAYTATYAEGDYRVSIAGGEPNYFRIDGGKLVIVAHE